MSLTPHDSGRSGAPAQAADPAWVDGELLNPHVRADKANKVRRMFAAIAGSYDLNNRVHSLGRDQAWRRYAVKVAQVQPGEEVLDVACGTGDLTQAFATSPAKRVVGLDFTPEMLDFANKKRAFQPSGCAEKLSYLEGDAQSLPFADGSFDVVSIAFGIRNVLEPSKALREFFRVLRPGGRLVILEFERPKNALVRVFNDLYCGAIMPRTATIISKDTSGAYKYLPKSVATFLTREQMRSQMAEAGFGELNATGLTMGICVCYRGVKAK
jgi:demethylmenaquinone methyltransferase/2-methoxy-6-polyprenyl-1,4-benzoquinol methylase